MGMEIPAPHDKMAWFSKITVISFTVGDAVSPPPKERRKIVWSKDSKQIKEGILTLYSVIPFFMYLMSFY